MYGDLSCARIWKRSHECKHHEKQTGFDDLESLSDASKTDGRLGGGESEYVIHFLRGNLFLRQLASGDFADFEREASFSANLLGGKLV